MIIAYNFVIFGSYIESPVIYSKGTYPGLGAICVYHVLLSCIQLNIYYHKPGAFGCQAVKVNYSPCLMQIFLYVDQFLTF